MRIRDFAEKYGISAETLMSRKCMGDLPSNIFYYPLNSKVMYVDESFFTRRWAFKNRVKYNNQDMFYLLTEYFSISELSKCISNMYGGNELSLNMYFSRSLFAYDHRNTITITMLEYRAWKYFKQIERRLKRRGTSIEQMLDIRMNKVNV